MVSARQELDLRPQLERLDALLLRSAGIEPGALSFEFRPLWQLSSSEKADVALKKAQATAAYAGVNLWPAEVTALLVEGQLSEDGIYPNAEAIFAEAGGAEGGVSSPVSDFSPDQPRDPNGRWTRGNGSNAAFEGQKADNLDLLKYITPEYSFQMNAVMSEDCMKKWESAYKICRQLLAEFAPNRRLTGGYRTLQGCAKGFVSAQCGGNSV